jgi:hypothetical protein
MMRKENGFDCQQRVMLCVTLYVTEKSDCEFVSSKHKTCLKQKIYTTEIVQASSDCVTE